MAILQQFDFDIVYKSAAQMTVPDALSRNIEYPECMDSSPEEEDPYFPYVDEKPTQIRVMTPNQTMEKLFPEVNLVHAQQFQTHPYSLSVLKAMNHTSSKNPQIQKLLEKCHELLTYKEIVLCWIPSHIGIQGNEMVDKQAKTSLSLEPTSFKIPFSNFKPSINKYILEELQTSWNNSIGNKLLDIKPTIGEYQSVVRNIRREEVVLARLRLGHTRVTHSYLLQGEEHPQCVGCDAPFTVRHFLLECGDFAQVRNNCFHVNNMKELFQDIHIDSIMTFLRQINLFNKI